MSFRATAPGSLMLLGEYAVLQGKPALVCAVDKRIAVTVTPRDDDQIVIESSTLGSYATTLSQLQIEKPFQFVLGALQFYQIKLTRGCHIEITTEFSDKVGFGSSAAVTVATIAALATWLNVRLSPLELVRQARNVIRAIQGVGSGADVAASVYGGVVAYQTQPLTAEKLSITHPLIALYAGCKTPTVTAIKHVQNKFEAYPNLFRELTTSIGQCAIDGIQLLRKENWLKFAEMMSIQQGLMTALGVNTPLLQAMTDDLQKHASILGVKISGSGLGDCVIGLGTLPEDYTFIGEHPGVQLIPVAMSLTGVDCEKI